MGAMGAFTTVLTAGAAITFLTRGAGAAATTVLAMGAGAATTVLARGAAMGAMGAALKTSTSAQGTGMLASLTQGADLPRRAGTPMGAARGVAMVLTAGVANTAGFCTATAGAATDLRRGDAPRGRAADLRRGCAPRPRATFAPGTRICGSASGAGTPRAEATMARTTT